MANATLRYQEFTSSGVQKFRSSRVHEFTSSEVQKFRSSGVHEFTSSRVHEEERNFSPTPLLPL
ncbi:hypothetical protein, partial [Anabaena sp. AL93]|uniref:hypothetical protein n=1 Tax=Anabaena sp. AL93 TaxID=1678133 RepID=UPI0025B85F80